MIGKILKKIQFFSTLLRQTRQEVYDNRVLLGKLLSLQQQEVHSLQDAEYKVFSQYGDDGIIQYLIKKAVIRSQSFVEFGVETYVEANTRFLLINNNWKGLVMDGSQQNIDYIQSDPFFWQYHLIAKQTFITAENINSLLTESGFSGPLGLLSIDIDGNDYWVWKAIQAADPDIVVAEYNSLFGAERAITVPYKPDFVRSKAHYSHLYFGTSLVALCDLATEKGYSFVGCNSTGLNAYFVKTSQLGTLKPLTAAEGYVYSKFREARDPNGNLTYATGNDRVEVIRGLPVFNTRTQGIEPF
ncbi:hypothetical protein LX87_02605 [Larkinella arboricola]|uniref:Uncharacterized protein n=1 Tax=Larkinella arboricola TaxID=643671 RepID=A0A327WWK2_LARAB|nr:hypothetical protein [Larkinella arboricola]RAJ97702.1 hypothetical protein LX87_02605 [Larkinella arboricola]